MYVCFDGSGAFDGTQRLLAAANQRETAMQEILFAKRLLLIIHTHVIEIYATGFDGLACLGNRLEQTCLHTGFRHSIAHCRRCENFLAMPVFDLESLDCGFKRSLIDARQIPAAPEQRACCLDGLIGRFFAMHKAGDFPCQGTLRLARARIGFALLDQSLDFGLRLSISTSGRLNQNW